MYRFGKIYTQVFVLFWAVTQAAIDYSCLHASSWALNTGGVNANLGNSPTDVYSSGMATGTNSWTVTTYGVPSYAYKISSNDVSTLNNRPNKATDFTSGTTTAVALQYYNLVRHF
jgi:hypothetical protein